MEDILAIMRELFEQWGMPKSIRSDNGEPFGLPSREVIPPMSLWLLGWGIRPILNRPGKPTDNAHVENNQRTSANWVEIDTCADWKDLQQKLDHAASIQRDFYKVRKLGNQTRKQYFPQLYNNPRSFDPEKFDPLPVKEYLQQAIYPRLVSSSGNISLYSKAFFVGRRYKKQPVICQFDAQRNHWKCLNKKEQIIKVIPDLRFEKENLLHLTAFQ